MAVPGEELHAALDGGWLLPEPAPREPVHTRSIVCRSFRRDDAMIDIDGRFIDTRPFDYESDFRGPCQAGSALHNMQVRVTIDRTRHIHALVSAMPGTPYSGCAGVNPNFQRLVGLSIGRGFRKAMRDRIGGVEGCTHVIALLDAMAAAAVQAFASAAYAPRKPGQPEPVKVWKLDALIDSCHSYRADGEVIRAMRARGR
ncbi:MAG: DUF2889 domain-containing protein [Burkholderiaceae bacterium]|nr:DUF2889 domain-containing protein [Burkholderiaceae bacterium]